jgi:hypothetical protein
MGEVYSFPAIHIPEEISSGYSPLTLADAELTLCESFGRYVPRNPEKTVLQRAVAGHLETFLARQRERDRVVCRAL